MVYADWWDDIGPGNIPLLSAVSEGLITRDPAGKGMWADYVFDGELLGAVYLSGLAKRRLIDLPLLGSPEITEYGRYVLEHWDEAEWRRRRDEQRKAPRASW